MTLSLDLVFSKFLYISILNFLETWQTFIDSYIHFEFQLFQGALPKDLFIALLEFFITMFSYIFFCLSVQGFLLELLDVFLHLGLLRAEALDLEV